MARAGLGDARSSSSRRRARRLDAGHPEKGYYKDLHPSNLLAKTYSELISRAGIDPSEVGDVVTGCAQQFGEAGGKHRAQRLA